MTNGRDRITHPLRDLAEQSRADLFTIVIRVVLDPGADPAASLAAAPAVLNQVADAIVALVPGANSPPAHGPDARTEKIVDDGSTASAVLNATLTGQHVLDLDAKLSPDLPVEMRRERVRPSDDAGAFDPGSLVGRVIAEPLSSKIRRDADAPYDVIIVIDSGHAKGRKAARDNIVAQLEIVKNTPGGSDVWWDAKQDASHPYVFARMTGAQVLALATLDRHPTTGKPAIFRIWEDTEVKALISRSVATVKADAAQIAFSAVGKGIVWAVLDSGVDVEHPHFRQHRNLELRRPLRHRDFTQQRADGASPVPADPAVHADSAAPPGAVAAEDLAEGPGDDPGAIVDAFGHGTHVAGIIAGSWSDAAFDAKAPPDASKHPVILTTERNESGAEERRVDSLGAIGGMAPQCTIVSFRVLDEKGSGNVSWIINAFDEIQQLNDYGRKLVIHGVNLSLGYPFDAKWFACGQSPLCVEVDRLVRSGVVVVVAAGNSGYGYVSTTFTKVWASGLPMTINDPGNAELAITVGSTHREQPHRYGVSYFSSKGPTGDGRMKPDLVAPGERIVSAASKQSRLPNSVTKDDGTVATVGADDFTYREDSGTSMAAPHVSGLIAAFLSIRGEYVGRPEDVKQLFLTNATDLKRDHSYQGTGLVDLMRAIQAV